MKQQIKNIWLTFQFSLSGEIPSFVTKSAQFCSNGMVGTFVTSRKYNQHCIDIHNALETPGEGGAQGFLGPLTQTCSWRSVLPPTHTAPKILMGFLFIKVFPCFSFIFPYIFLPKLFPFALQGPRC